MGRILLCGLVLLLAACNEEADSDSANPPLVRGFQFLGLENHIIKQLLHSPESNQIVSATDKGIFLFNEDGDEWLALSPQDWSVNSMVMLSDFHLLASISSDTGNALMESLDGGAHWDGVSTDFGGIENSDDQEMITAMVFDEGSGLLYGTGLGVLAQSDDYGRHWQVLDGQWQMAASGLSVLKLHPHRYDLWYGGQGGIENPQLFHLSGADEVSDHSQQMQELLSVPSVIKGITFVDSDSAHVLASGEGGVVQSRDYGLNWEPLLVNEQSRFYFDILVDPRDRDTFYTAGWDKNFTEPQALVLQISEDGGEHWRSFRAENAALRGGVWSMLFDQRGEQRQLYLGLCNGGVVRVPLRD